MSAKAGIQGYRINQWAVDSRLRACEEIETRLDQRGASFERAAARPPQDEVHSRRRNNLPHAEERLGRVSVRRETGKA